MGAPPEPSDWEALTRSIFSHAAPVTVPAEHAPVIESAPVIDGQGRTPAPPPGMDTDTRAMLNLISLPGLRS